jgi:16S rRNA (adenine1518-N6/adenine1519-N6)-dimethyltransferase
LRDETFLPARKGLGQNFLHDQRVIADIVAGLNPKIDDTIVEIGPGRGALTKLLLERQCDLHLIEFDRDLANYWRDKAATIAHLTLYEIDVLKFDFGDFLGNSPIRVIGNLPYNISSPVLFRLLAARKRITDMVFMFQKEVVDRMVAQPGSKQFGRLSVILQQACRCERILQVPAGAFSPPPKVKSAVVRIVPHEVSDYRLIDEGVFGRLVKQAFSMRRKTLRNSLKEWFDAKDYETLEIDSSNRPERLAVGQFVALANCFANKSGL